MRKLISLFAALAVTSTLFAVAPASASSVYTLKWDWNHLDRFLGKGEVARIKWSTSPKAAPAPKATAPQAHPCKAESFSSALGTAWYAAPERVTNGNASQKCTVTLAATQNGSYRGSPGSIAHDYVVLSNEALTARPGSWCVTSCRYEDGWTDAIFRIRSTGQCYRSYYSPREGGSPSHGTSAIVPCPNRLFIDAPQSAKQYSKFNVRAWSNLGIDVKLATSTPAICRVLATNAPMNHTVIGITPGMCKMSATTRASELWDTPSTVYDQTLITACVTCPVPDLGATAEPDEATFAYGTPYTGTDLLSNDFGTGTLTAALETPADKGSVTVTPSGSYTYTAPPRFTGTATFSYLLTDASGSTDTATVTVTITPGAPPAAPVVAPGLTIAARQWMRVGVKETISLVPSFMCDGVPATAATCGTRPSAGTVTGAYVEVVGVSDASFALSPPAKYPSTRYSVAVDASSATLSGVTGTARFQQATAVSAKFTATASMFVTYRVITWTNYNDVLVQNVLATRTSPATATASFGVTGATR